MPIRPELRPLYPPHWRELSLRVRFERAGGKCQACGRPHLAQLRCLPDGRWFDAAARTWRNWKGRPCRWPDLVEAAVLRTTRVVLAAAHLDGDPTNNRLANLKSLCQRCHTIWRSAGSPIGGAGPWEICSWGAIRPTPSDRSAGSPASDQLRGVNCERRAVRRGDHEHYPSIKPGRGGSQGHAVRCGLNVRRARPSSSRNARIASASGA